MLSIQECDQYFANHPENNEYLSYPENIRIWALNQAWRHLECAGVLSAEAELVRTACCEEALFLLTNPQSRMPTFEVVQERIDGIGSRTYAPQKTADALPLSPYVRAMVSAFRQGRKKSITRG